MFQKIRNGIITYLLIKMTYIFEKPLKNWNITMCHMLKVKITSIEHFLNILIELFVNPPLHPNQ